MIDDVQFGFMKSKGTTDAIFTVRETQCFDAVGWAAGRASGL